MNRRLGLCVLALAVSVSCGCLPGAEVAGEFGLDRLDIGLVTSGAGGDHRPRWNAGITGRPLQIGSKTFKRGFGTHARSDLHVRLFKSASRFAATVGVDASGGEPAGKGSIEFIVRGDGKVLWRSGVMRRSDAAKRVAVDLKGVDVLTLEVTDGGNGTAGDFAAWGDAVIVTTGRDPVAVPPPAKLLFATLDPFYTQYVSAGGLLISASDKVSPYALKEAAYLVDKLLATRRDVLDALLRRRVRVGVMAYNEMTTAIPAHRALSPWYDMRARGLGGNPVTCGEENLLAYKGDPYRGESIFIHEFSHIVHGGFQAVDKTFEPRLKALHKKAKASGRVRAYGVTSFGEFWAEGVQSWFNCNRRGGLEIVDANGKHVCSANTRADVKKHLPDLAKLLAESFRGNEWAYVPVLQRLGEPHLKGYDPAKAPTFKWPKHVIEAARKAEAEMRARKRKKK